MEEIVLGPVREGLVGFEINALKTDIIDWVKEHIPDAELLYNPGLIYQSGYYAPSWLFETDETKAVLFVLAWGSAIDKEMWPGASSYDYPCHPFEVARTRFDARDIIAETVQEEAEYNRRAAERTKKKAETGE